MSNKIELTKTLEVEKVALDKQVRELKFELEVKAEDLSEKEVSRKQAELWSASSCNRKLQ